jgi:hypothetical protein
MSSRPLAHLSSWMPSICEGIPRRQDMNTTTTTPLPLGQLLATLGAIRAMREASTNPAQLFRRHAYGDWGDLHEDDHRANALAIREGMRVLSAYVLATDERVWVITEADRSATTILLPEEY